MVKGAPATAAADPEDLLSGLSPREGLPWNRSRPHDVGLPERRTHDCARRGATGLFGAFNVGGRPGRSALASPSSRFLVNPPATGLPRARSPATRPRPACCPRPLRGPAIFARSARVQRLRQEPAWQVPPGWTPH
jgi:hypothetical protein